MKERDDEGKESLDPEEEEDEKRRRREAEI